jgi:hypothetical protein
MLQRIQRFADSQVGWGGGENRTSSPGFAFRSGEGRAANLSRGKKSVTRLDLVGFSAQHKWFIKNPAT